MTRRTILALLFLCAVVEANWNIQFGTGAVHNFSTNLEFGNSTIDADYETRPFQTPLYYSVLTGISNWKVELIHQKIFLKNPTGELQSFGISHGYNLLLFNYETSFNDWVVGGGAGVVIVHPEVGFADHFYEPGYLLTGPAFQIYIQRKFFLSNSFYLSAESKFTGGRAHFSVASMPVSAPNFALHALFGAGWEFGRTKHL